ncbi:ABC-2 type transport system ATP-binding protein [Nakamurella panacisegetis]|uniref:ABC-2 type transport system ATP-binding protein n=1 Tax=Nakamurella panacisegetis TaxID=1090615 RepID=A0A1H0RQ77_9ACTN|nr:alpha/beta fold hydrolase [Nakamurella panacisegetis]SDP31701.1 ABC-2 type transport system ATP-binding protein [Nakamurella panacisegetis]
MRLDRLLAGRTRKLLASLVALVIVAAIVLVATPKNAEPSSAVRTQDETISVPGGPGVTGQVKIDATLYLPPGSGRAPAVLMAHGFGGSKQSVAGDARTLAARGFVVLAYSARGFGHSSGQIALDSLEYEVPDARALVSWLATRPEVQLDGPGDPRVGVTGASYGGALSLMLAGTDPRIDAVAPLITWNNLATALFPNAVAPPGAVADGTPAQADGSSNGVFKKSWAANLLASVISGSALSGATSTTAPSDNGDAGFGRGKSTTAAPPDPNAGSVTDGSASSSATTTGCGRLMPALCAAYSTAAQTGMLDSTLSALLARSSPSAVVGRITAPTLLVQGERDTLFGLDQADANARAIAARGTTVAVTWYNGGHDGGSPDQVTQDRITNWFSYYLSGIGAKPSTAFSYSVDGPLSDTGVARTRTLQVPAYLGVSGAARTPEVAIPLTGATQTVLNPPGGAPAGISAIPGLSALAGNALSALSSGIPGQVARFTSAPLKALTVIAGTPTVSVSVSSVSLPQSAGSDRSGAVLFASISKISAGGVRTLAGNAVAPVRLTGLPADGSSRTVTINLPAVALQVEAGSRIEITLTTTDQAYAGPTAPAVYRVGLAGNVHVVTVPEVGGIRVSAGDIPVGTLVALIVLALIAVVALVLGGRVRTRRPAPAAAGAPSPSPADRLPLVITGLGKSYPGGVAAVTDVTFTVGAGQVLGLLGPNGAGKTTTLRMVMGLITPTSGEIRVFGQRVRPGAEILARIGSFVEGSGFLPHLSGRANLDLYWRATGRPRADAHLDEALEIAALGKAINRKVKTYSQGMRQRLAIAQAMLGLPDLLLLDEPTNGLDPPQIHAMREVLRGYAATGRTVLVSSHMLSEVEQTCSHVVVVHQGRTIAAGTVADMVSASGDMVFSVDDPDRAITVLRSLPGVRAVELDDPDLDRRDGGLLRADLGSCRPADAVSALVGAGVGIRTAAPRNRLEDVFLELVGAADPIAGGSR